MLSRARTRCTSELHAQIGSDSPKWPGIILCTPWLASLPRLDLSRKRQKLNGGLEDPNRLALAVSVTKSPRSR